MKTQIIYLALIAATLWGFSCSKSSKVSSHDNNDTESTTMETADSDTINNSESSESLSSETDETNETDDGIARFDTDPTSDCVHPMVTEKCINGWCEIPAGCFIFGAPQDQPCRAANSDTQVQVTLTRSFVIQQYEVTQKQWKDAEFPNPTTTGPYTDYVDDDKPVTYVNWYEAMAYANALSKKEGLAECYNLSNCTGTVGSGCQDQREFCYIKQWNEVYNCEDDPHVYDDWYACPGYRLPTAVEWEYAARAGTMTATYNGNFQVFVMPDEYKVEPTLEPIAWYKSEEGEDQLYKVGLKRANNWGLFDVLGNADEWIDYIETGWNLATNEGTEGPLVDPVGTKEETDLRRCRNGGNPSMMGCWIATAHSTEYFASDRTMNGGFRLVRTLPSDK